MAKQLSAITNQQEQPDANEAEKALSLQIQAYLTTASDELYAPGKPLYTKEHHEGVHECMKMWQKLHNYYFSTKQEQPKIYKDESLGSPDYERGFKHGIDHQTEVARKYANKDKVIAYLVDKGYPVNTNGEIPTYQETFDMINNAIKHANKQEQPECSGSLVDVDAVREDFMTEVYRVLASDPTNDRANAIINAFDSLPTVSQRPNVDLVAELKHHLATTPKEQLEKEWKELEAWNNIGPTVQEFLYGKQPEVDLEKDAVSYCYDNGINISPRQAKGIARHFWNKGYNARKED